MCLINSSKDRGNLFMLYHSPNADLGLLISGKHLTDCGRPFKLLLLQVLLVHHE